MTSLVVLSLLAALGVFAGWAILRRIGRRGLSAIFLVVIASAYMMWAVALVACAPMLSAIGAPAPDQSAPSISTGIAVGFAGLLVGAPSLAVAVVLLAVHWIAAHRRYEP